jgi:protein translocase SecG subunit
MPLSDILLIIQVFALTMSVILILMQNRGAGLSSTFGGGSGVYLTRRGIEKSVVTFTVVSIIVFIIARIVALYI